MRNMMRVSLTCADKGTLLGLCNTLLLKHLIISANYSEDNLMYWQGGQIISKKLHVARCVTSYDLVFKIESLLSDNVTMVGESQLVYINSAVGKWINESLAEADSNEGGTEQ